MRHIVHRLHIWFLRECLDDQRSTLVLIMLLLFLGAAVLGLMLTNPSKPEQSPETVVLGQK